VGFPARFAEEVDPAGIYTLELWSSTDPLSGSLLANDPLLNDLYGALRSSISN